MKTATDLQPEAAGIPAVRTSDDDGDGAERPPTDVSWVARCQRQFDDTDRDLRNLVDGQNAAFYDGV